MPYRDGDATVEIEARVEHTTARAYLIEPTMGEKRAVWLPKSQTVEMTECGDGLFLFTVTKWWFQRSGMEDE